MNFDGFSKTLLFRGGADSARLRFIRGRQRLRRRVRGARKPGLGGAAEALAKRSGREIVLLRERRGARGGEGWRGRARAGVGVLGD